MLPLDLLYSGEKEKAIDNSDSGSIIPFGIMQVRRNAYEA